jgi:MbtH protein
MAAVSDPGKTWRNAFAVVVNDQGQHSVWQAELELPPGWRRQSAAMPRQACLDAIAGAGRDERRRHPVPRSGNARFADELLAEQASPRPGSAAVIARGNGADLSRA